MVEMIEFEWARCRDGYAVNTSPRKRLRARTPQRVVTKPRRMVEGASTGLVAASNNFELYSPTKFPELFQLFADAEPTADGMIGFANSFGLLGGIVDWGAVGPSRVMSQSLDDVLAHHHRLRAAVSDQAVLECASDFGWARLGVKLVRQQNGKIAIALVPSSLILFLWVQLALFAGSDAQLFRCQQCGHPFSVGRESARRRSKKAKYCSNACRLAAFRARHASQARQGT